MSLSNFFLIWNTADTAANTSRTARNTAAIAKISAIAAERATWTEEMKQAWHDAAPARAAKARREGTIRGVIAIGVGAFCLIAIANGHHGATSATTGASSQPTIVTAEADSGERAAAMKAGTFDCRASATMRRDQGGGYFSYEYLGYDDVTAYCEGNLGKAVWDGLLDEQERQKLLDEENRYQMQAAAAQAKEDAIKALGASHAK